MTTIASRWIRFLESQAIGRVDDQGTVEGIVHVATAETDLEAFLDAASEALTGSIVGLEDLQTQHLGHGMYLVSGRISDYGNEDAPPFEELDPNASDFTGVLAAAMQLTNAEATHAAALIRSGSSTTYGDECVIQTRGMRQIRCPADPAPCDYVRITLPAEEEQPLELAYWVADEWAEAPAEVMGAILGALRGPRS